MRDVVFLPDIHLRGGENLTRAWRVAKQFVKSIKPDGIVYGGDFLDMESLSGWNQDKRRLMEMRRFSKEMQLANRELDDVQNACPDSRYWFLEGNHEGWVERYIDRHPNMEGVLELEEQLRMKERGMEWVKENKILKIGKMHFIHGWKHNVYHAAKHLQLMGDNVMYGHVHKPQMHTQVLAADRQPHCAWSTGCLCDLNPQWLRDKPNNWQHGFGYVEFRSDGRFQAHLINIIKGCITFGGETWRAK